MTQTRQTVESQKRWASIKIRTSLLCHDSRQLYDEGQSECSHGKYGRSLRWRPVEKGDLNLLEPCAERGDLATLLWRECKRAQLWARKDTKLPVTLGIRPPGGLRLCISWTAGEPRIRSLSPCGNVGQPETGAGVKIYRRRGV